MGKQMTLFVRTHTRQWVLVLLVLLAGLSAQARNSDEFARLAFTGLELAPPGVVLVSEWRPSGDGPRPTPAAVNCYGGVARKP